MKTVRPLNEGCPYSVCTIPKFATWYYFIFILIVKIMELIIWGIWINMSTNLKIWSVFITIFKENVVVIMKNSTFQHFRTQSSTLRDGTLGMLWMPERDHINKCANHCFKNIIFNSKKQSRVGFRDGRNIFNMKMDYIVYSLTKWMSCNYKW